MRKIVLLLLFVPFISFAQTKQDTLWMPFKNFIGKWEGTSEGQSGKGRYERSYQFILNKKFIEVRNKSIYPPSTQNPKGEVHEDIGYISYDRGRKSFVLRQFHIEGFVNQYKLESISADGKTMVFITESIENIPPGFKARESYQFTGTEEFIESFELAEPGKEFGMYSKATLRKIR
jgi:hypothetical protein